MRLKNFAVRLGILTLLVSLIFFSLAPATWSESYKIYPLGDTYVYEGSPESNYSTEDTLRVGISESNHQYESYLLFDLSIIPASQTITSGTFGIYAREVEPFLVSVWITITATVPDYDPEAITWETKPHYINTLGYINIKVYPYWYISNIDPSWFDYPKMSFGLISKDEDNGDKQQSKQVVYFYSKEKSGFQPYLSVETRPIPLPGAVWLLGGGLMGLGLLGFRRMRRP